MQLTCLYHPTLPMQLIDDEEVFDKMVTSGQWFTSHIKANEVREHYEKRIHAESGLHPKRRKRRSDS